jgi:hypothetical protein
LVEHLHGKEGVAGSSPAEGLVDFRGNKAVGDKLTGIAVNVGARLSALARPREVVVSSTSGTWLPALVCNSPTEESPNSKAYPVLGASIPPSPRRPSSSGDIPERWHLRESTETEWRRPNVVEEDRGNPKGTTSATNVRGRAEAESGGAAVASWVAETMTEISFVGDVQYAEVAFNTSLGV